MSSSSPRATRRPARPPPSVDAGGRVTGSAGFVLDAFGADVLVVAAVDETSGRPRAVVFDGAVEGLEVERIVRYDATRPLAHVRLDQAAGQVLDVGSDVLADAWYVTQALLA